MKLLSTLDLSGITQLKSIKTIYKLSNLTHLNLSHCSSIIEGANGIRTLKELKYLNVIDCKRMLPADVRQITKLADKN